MHIGVVDQRVMIASQDGQSSGWLYTLFASNGNTEIEATRIISTMRMRILGAHTIYQGTLVFIGTEGSIRTGSNSLNTLNPEHSSSSDYVIGYFNRNNLLISAIYLLNGKTQNEVNIKIWSHTETLPSFIIFTGDSQSLTAYSLPTNFNLLTSSSGPNTNCMREVQGFCFECKPGYRLNEHMCEVCGRCRNNLKYVPVALNTCNNREFEVEGSCKEKCNIGYKALRNNVCLMKCPDGTILNYRETKSDNVEEGSTTPRYLIRFINESPGLELPVDQNFIQNFPDEWTMTMWVKLNTTHEIQRLVTAFNYIKVDRRQTSPSNGYVSISLDKNHFAPRTHEVSRTSVLRDVHTWNYIAISKGVYLDSSMQRTMLINNYVFPNSSRFTSLYYSTSAEDVKPTSLRASIILGGDNDDKFKRSDSFNGFMLEFRFFLRYMNFDYLDYYKYRMQSPERLDMLAYWDLRIDPSKLLPSSNVPIILKDKSPFKKDALRSLTTARTTFPYIFENRYTETFEGGAISGPNEDDIFYYYNQIPSFFLSTGIYTCATPQYIPSISTFTSLYDIITTAILSNGLLNPYYAFKDITELDDILYITKSDCITGYTAPIAQKIVISQSQRSIFAISEAFSQIEVATNYRLCYKSAAHLTTHFLSWIYVVRVPEEIIPNNKFLYKQWSGTISYEVIGGDDGFNSIYYIARSINTVTPNCATNACITSMYKYYEGPGKYSRRINGPIDIGVGTYYFFWRPKYMERYELYQMIPKGYIKHLYVGPVYFSNSVLNS